ncbi:hypothetical protein [uncultured Pseudodesulfovibrio sp.]|uniref:hypothetical protein n=1 Tax=uncultured Pseudodesulfovibrio sp. TaxID=2035858 RepID=UPI0029C7E8EF|nr:hypothetical protein [uncultured Pseudodesulfovibrio sp.]
MSYRKEFQAAVNRTAKWKLGGYAIDELDTPVDQSVLNELEATSHIPFAERAGKGMSVNFGMYHMLLTRFGIQGAVITMGNVSINGEMRLPVTASHFKKMIKHQSGEENMSQYHLWTTLPGGIVLDHVILSSLHGEGLVEVNDAIPTERYICGPGDELPHGLEYHPIVVGVDFFVASGTIDPEAMDYLMGSRFPKQYD